MAIVHTTLVYEEHQISFSSLSYGKAMPWSERRVFESYYMCVYCNVMSIDIECTIYTQMYKEFTKADFQPNSDSKRFKSKFDSGFRGVHNEYV